MQIPNVLFTILYKFTSQLIIIKFIKILFLIVCKSEKKVLFPFLNAIFKQILSIFQKSLNVSPKLICFKLLNQFCILLAFYRKLFYFQNCGYHFHFQFF